MEKIEIFARHPRRKFFTHLLSSMAGAAALLLAPRRARAEAKKAHQPVSGPILYHRNEETERYYRTLYR
jgi:hypothetical protein